MTLMRCYTVDSDLYLIGLAVLVVIVVACSRWMYWKGRYTDVELRLRANDGWQDEALWWREHATGIIGQTVVNNYGDDS